MLDQSKHSELVSATVEEVARWLSAIEGKPVSIQEVRRIECQALRKLRSELIRRGLRWEDMDMN